MKYQNKIIGVSIQETEYDVKVIYCVRVDNSVAETGQIQVIRHLFSQGWFDAIIESLQVRFVGFEIMTEYK